MAISIKFLNQAVTLRESNIKHINDEVKFYLEKLNDISNETDTVTSTQIIFIFLLMSVLNFVSQDRTMGNGTSVGSTKPFCCRNIFNGNI